MRLNWKIRRRILFFLLFFWVATLILQRLLQFISDRGDEKEMQERLAEIISSTLQLPVAAYAPWVHGTWIRVPSTGAVDKNVLNIVEEYRQIGFPVQVVFIDHHPISPSRNSLSIQQMKSIVKDLHEKGLRVVVSTNSFSQQGTIEFNQCRKELLLLGLVKGNNTLLNWQYRTGNNTSTERGSLLDLTNPEALRLYRKRLDTFFSMGVDGLWNDAMDSLFSSAFEHGVRAYGGFVDSSLYGMDYYYQTFDYGREKKGFDFVTSFLPVDAITENSGWRSFGPTDISFVSVVRNQRFSYAGLNDAVIALTRSLEMGYINVGIEPHGTIENNDVDVALRWVQLSALCPTMFLPLQQLGQIKENSLSIFSDLISEFQRLSQLHETLRPYYYSLGSLAFFDQFESRKRASLNWTDIPFVMHPGKMMRAGHWCSFHIGTDLFFVSLTEPVENQNLKGTQTIPVKFPVEYGPWVPHTASHMPFAVYESGSTELINVNMTQLLLFQRAGSAIPVHMPSLPNALTVLIQSPHLSTYPARRVLGKEVPQRFVNDEIAVIFTENGEKHVLWYKTETTPEGQFWLNFNGTAFGKKIVICVRGLIGAKELESSGYEFAISIDNFAQYVVLDTSAVYIKDEQICFFSSLMTVESTTRIGPLTST